MFSFFSKFKVVHLIEVFFDFVKKKIFCVQNLKNRWVDFYKI